MMIKTDILVPTFGQEQYTVRCFDSVLRHSAGYRLVWIDNGSSAEGKDIVQDAFARHQSRLSVWLPRNVGFVKGMNAGLQACLDVVDAGSKYVVLLNNDTEVTAGWLDRMIAIMENDEKIAAVGPLTSTAGSWQGWENAKRKIPELEFPDNFEELDTAGRAQYLESTYDTQPYCVKMLAFFCTVFRREVFSLDKVGRLDERFGMGLGDDDDVSLRIRNAGWTLALSFGSYVFHNHRTTFKSLFGEPEIKQMTKKAIQTYREKHGIPTLT